MTATATSRQDLIEAFDSAHLGVLVVTGAGISRASGIQTFRGSEPGAIWSNHDVELATRRMLQVDPVAHWCWYLDRFAAVDGAEPNDAHRALRDLERWAEARGLPSTTVTQNIDLLHEAAGSHNLIKVHGTAGRLRCSAVGCTLAEPTGSIDRAEVDLGPFRSDPSTDTLPRCPECDEVLRPHVLFFDEYYDAHRDYRIDDVVAAAAEADVVLFVGTSFSVGITDILLRAACESGAAMFSVDPHAEPPAGYPLRHLAEPAETLLPQVVSALDASPQT